MSNFFERLAVQMIRAFEAVRLDHMGCMFSLPILLGLGYLYLFLLNHLVHEPVRYAYADDIALVAWLIVAGMTSHTHFSGHETMKDKLGITLLY